jgi:hypothetical protein
MKSNRTHTWQLFSHSGKNLPLILHGFLALSLYAQQLLAVRACLRATKALPALRWRTWCALRSRRYSISWLKLSRWWSPGKFDTAQLCTPWDFRSKMSKLSYKQLEDLTKEWDLALESASPEFWAQNCALWLDSSGVMNFLHHGNQVASCNRAQQDNEISKRNSIKSGVYYLSIHSVPLKKMPLALWVEASTWRTQKNSTGLKWSNWGAWIHTNSGEKQKEYTKTCSSKIFLRSPNPGLWITCISCTGESYERPNYYIN